MLYFESVGPISDVHEVRPRKKKEVVLPSVTDPSEELKLKKLWWEKHAVLFRLGVFEKSGGKCTQTLYFWECIKK